MKITPMATMAALAAAGGIAYGSVIRPWYQRWGATDEEIARPMPLDERVPDPTISTTMAITIDSPPGAIWPWLVQVGDPPRAGYYSYTWIEKLVGLDIQNAGRILPEFQAVDSRAGIGPQRHDGRAGGRAREITRPRSARFDRLPQMHLGFRALPHR